MARSREDGSRQAVDGQLAAREDWRARLENTNINPDTLLATDYLNHFNEVVMLLDLVAEMPDCRADLAEWRPCTYPEHFRQSGFAYSDLAIAAWEHVTPDRRQAFDAVIDRLNAAILHIVARIMADEADAAEIAAASQGLHELLEEARGLINGTATLAPLAPRGDAPAAEAPSLRQDDIDDLFG